MTGWHISVYKLSGGGNTPATPGSARDIRLAVWQTDSTGLRWLSALVKENKAVDLGGNGYPSRYSLTLENLLPHLEGAPPGARATWAYDPGDVLTDKWVGKTGMDRAAIAACRDDEWVLVEAWDES